MTDLCYRILNWETNFENNRTRELQRLDWVPIPNRHDGHGFRALIERKDGVELFGAWVLILEIASKCSPRGCLMRHTGVPHTAESLGRMCGASPRVLQRALDILSSAEIGWLSSLPADLPQGLMADAPQVDKKRAHSRLNRAIKNGSSILTPLGLVNARPSSCQWCSAPLLKQGQNHPSVVAHHLLGYGNYAVDTTVIFVCRSCHGHMENGNILERAIFERFGVAWMEALYLRTEGATRSHPAAISAPPASRPPATMNGREGREEKGMEEYTQEARACEADESWIESAFERIAAVYPPHALRSVDGKRAVYEACVRSLTLRSELRFGRDLPAIRRNGEQSDDPLSLTVDECLAGVVAWSASAAWAYRGAVPTLRNYIERGTCLDPAPPPERDGREAARLRELQAPAFRAEPTALNVPLRLQALATRLPETVPDRAALAEQILALSGDAEEVERQLSEIDRELLNRLAAAVNGEVVEAVERSLRAIQARLPAEQVEEQRKALTRQAIRRRLQIPVLSLFAPEADGAEIS